MSNASTSKQLVSLVHFLARPRKNRLGLSHISHDRVHEMRQASVATKFNHLRVDHQHPHIVRCLRHQDRRDDCVQANGLTGTRPSGDQQVRKLRQIDREWIARYVFSEIDRNGHFLRVTIRFVHHLAKTHDLSVVVGHLDADCVLARNRRDDPHARNT